MRKMLGKPAPEPAPSYPPAPPPEEYAPPPFPEAPAGQDEDALSFQNPIAPPVRKATPAKPAPPTAFPEFGLQRAQKPAAAAPAKPAKPAKAAAVPPSDLGFDIDQVEAEISPEQRREAQFEAIMDRFRNAVTTLQKTTPYEFASELGIEDKIENFYEFLGKPDKDGIIKMKGDDVIINKTKITGSLMLGDNSMLDRVMAGFRAWLMKYL
jgi:hypothetical protein